MDLLPYEILQLIAGNLLPRYQCRLALACRRHYECLYTYLLKWHAHKQHIPLPLYRVLHGDYHHNTILSLSVRKIPWKTPNIIVSHYSDGIFRSIHIDNITTMISHELDGQFDRYRLREMEPYYLYGCFKLFRDDNILSGTLQFINNDVMKMYIKMINPIHRLPINVFNKLRKKLDYKSNENLTLAEIDCFG